jgi:hypothetical protein
MTRECKLFSKIAVFLAAAILVTACSQGKSSHKAADTAGQESSGHDTTNNKGESAMAKAQNFANPYELADAALAAMKSGDASAFNALTGASTVTGQRLEESGVTTADRVVGLYFQEGTRDIAAVIRKGKAEQKAVWLRIERARSGGFVLKDLVIGGDNPEMEINVEGF